MSKYKIAFICPYFGKFPNHFNYWLKSCEKNKDCLWIIYTDDKRNFNFPNNVEVHYTTLVEMRNAFSRKLGFDVALPNTRKLGDYKPLFGYLFEEKIKGIKSWGHIDLADSIYGRITKFVTDDMREKYEKIMCCGHMSIYKNTSKNNKRFMTPLKSGIDYKTIFSDATFYNFEEIADISITRIYIENKIKIKELSDKYADISIKRYNFTMSRVKDDFSGYYLLKEKPMVFSWEDGILYKHQALGGKIQKKEYMYIHIKRRALNIDERIIGAPDRYIITQDGFRRYEKITKRYIKCNDKKRLLYKQKISNILDKTLYRWRKK